MEVTFDGRIEDGSLAVPIINVWYDKDDSAKAPPDGKPVVGKVRHGTTGELVERRGRRCRIRATGVSGEEIEGWLTYFWIREFKGGEEYDDIPRISD